MLKNIKNCYINNVRNIESIKYDSLDIMLWN